MKITRGCFLGIVLLCPALLHAETFRVATYNLENYLDQPTESRAHPKSAAAKSKIRESIRALNPDVLAVQEIGTLSALMELRASLKTEGLNFPDRFLEIMTGHVSELLEVIIRLKQSRVGDIQFSRAKRNSLLKLIQQRLLLMNVDCGSNETSKLPVG